MASIFLLLLSALCTVALLTMAGAALCPATVRGSSLYSQMAVGLALFPVVCVVPLFFIHSFYPAFIILAILSILGARKMRFSLPRSLPERIFWIAAVLNLTLLAFGTWRNPGLGDHDPYEHAMAVSYLFETASVFPQGQDWLDLATLDPYPPGYDSCAAALSFLTGSVAYGLRLWALICASLFPVMVRFLARGAGLSSNMSAVAGAVAVLLPPAPTHFAWTHTLGSGLTLASAGAIALSLQSSRWIPTAGISLASLGLSASSDIFFGLLFFVPIAWRAIRAHQLRTVAMIVAIAVILTGIWGVHVYHRMIGDGQGGTPVFKSTRFGTLRGYFDQAGAQEKPWYKKHVGNARPYEAGEFFVPHWKNYFNIPVGLPVAAFIPGLLGLIIWWKRKGTIWPLLTFLILMVAVQGERLPAEFFPHRCWTYLAVFTALGFAVFFFRFAHRGKPASGVVMAGMIFAALSLGHSLAVRVRMEIIQWGNEVFTSVDQQKGYYGLAKTVRGEKTYPLAGNSRFGYVPAFGGRVTFWNPPEREADRRIGEGKIGEAMDILKKAGYRFIILDSTVDLRRDKNASPEFYRSISSRKDIATVSVGEGWALFKLPESTEGP